MTEDTTNLNHIHNYYLTLGEFCVFATELRRRYDQYERSEQEMLNGEYLVCHKKDCSGRRTHTYKKCKHHHYHHPYRHNNISKSVGAARGERSPEKGVLTQAVPPHREILVPVLSIRTSRNLRFAHKSPHLLHPHMMCFLGVAVTQQVGDKTWQYLI